MVGERCNGFMNTDHVDCIGVPVQVPPQVAPPGQQNQVPWAALEGGVLMQQEIGHFEACTPVTNVFPVDVSFGSGRQAATTGLSDLLGGSEGSQRRAKGLATRRRANVSDRSTEREPPARFNHAAPRVPCEFSDGPCFPPGEPDPHR